MSKPAIFRVPIVTRTEWGAPANVNGLGALGTVKQITVHHTAQGAAYSAAAVAGVSQETGAKGVRAARASHLHNGWTDIGYHFLVDGAGHVFQGRGYLQPGSLGPDRTPPVLAKGSHVGGHNTGNIGVNVLGCFGAKGERDCGDVPSGEALTALTNLLAALCAAYGVSPSGIVGHRDLAPTACPGDRLYTKLEGIRQALRERGL